MAPHLDPYVGPHVAHIWIQIWTQNEPFGAHHKKFPSLGLCLPSLGLYGPLEVLVSTLAAVLIRALLGAVLVLLLADDVLSAQ